MTLRYYDNILHNLLKIIINNLNEIRHDFLIITYVSKLG